jgi:hypothetical protein
MGRVADGWAARELSIRHQPIKETLFASVILSLMDTSWDIKIT